MHPGDDDAVAARFLGWLQARGEDTEHLARDQARIGELLAWEVDDFGLERLDLDETERPRVTALIALWREFRESLPGGPPRHEQTSSWIARPRAEPVPPSSALPRLAPSRAAWRDHLRMGTREWILLGVLVGAATWISREGSSEPVGSEPAPVVAGAPGLRSDLDLRRTMAAALACRDEAARRLVASRAAVVADLSSPECLEDGPCRDRHDLAQRDLASARAFEDATRTLAARVAPLPRERCDRPAEGSR